MNMEVRNMENMAVAETDIGARDNAKKDKIWMDRDVLLRLLEELTARENPAQAGHAPGPVELLARLTHREREVADLISGGASNREIGQRLHVTEATVKAHLTAIFRKLGVTDRLQLGLFLARHARGSSVFPDQMILNGELLGAV